MHSRNCGRTRLSLILAMLGAVILLAGDIAKAAECSATNSRLAAILKRGKLLAGVRYDYPPNGYVDKDGKNKGFGPDIAREFANHLGVTVEMIQTKADGAEWSYRSRYRASDPRKGT